MDENPKLRSDLVVVPVEIQGEKLLFFQDPARWCEELVFMPVEFMPILQYFNGSMSIREIQESLLAETKELIPSDVIEKIATELDSRHLLDSENFRTYVDKVRTDWDQAVTRPAALAGQSYPDKPEELGKFLDEFFTAENGPGLPLENKGDQLKAVIAPHIELTGNGACYALAHKTLFEQSQAEVFIIIGTGHSALEDVMVLSEKSFATPLGVAETDKEFVRGIRKRLRKKNYLGDFSHRLEHSIELQVIFLQRMLAGKRDFKIVPILAGSFAQTVEVGASPAEDLVVRDYINAIRGQIESSGKKVAVIASADLAHLGPKFGDREGYTPIRELEIRSDDDKMLGELEKADAESFFAQVAGIKDRRKVCGLSPIYFALKIAQPARGELLKWAVSYDQQAESAVSFCSMAFY